MNWRSEKPSEWVAESFVWKVSIRIYFLRKVSELLWVQCRSIPWSLACGVTSKRYFKCPWWWASLNALLSKVQAQLFLSISWSFWVQISYKTISLDLWSSIIDQITHDRRRTAGILPDIYISVSSLHFLLRLHCIVFWTTFFSLLTLHKPRKLIVKFYQQQHSKWTILWEIQPEKYIANVRAQRTVSLLMSLFLFLHWWWDDGCIVVMFNVTT